jgi:hypothetical protein
MSSEWGARRTLSTKYKLIFGIGEEIPKTKDSLSNSVITVDNLDSTYFNLISSPRKVLTEAGSESKDFMLK